MTYQNRHVMLVPVCVAALLRCQTSTAGDTEGPNPEDGFVAGGVYSNPPWPFRCRRDGPKTSKDQAPPVRATIPPVDDQMLMRRPARSPGSSTIAAGAVTAFAAPLPLKCITH